MEYHPFEEKDWRGKVTSIDCDILGFTFKFSSSSWKKFLEFAKEGNLTISNGYLAREINGRTEYFHRQFKLGSAGFGLEVHHRNGNKEDNRSSNLKVMSEEEHKALHQKKIEKANERYTARGERIRQRYEERGERIREKYRKRGERMRAKFNKW